jgi:hypothetical protein
MAVFVVQTVYIRQAPIMIKKYLTPHVIKRLEETNTSSAINLATSPKKLKTPYSILLTALFISNTVSLELVL